MFNCMKCNKEMEKNTFTCVECFRNDNPKEDILASIKNRENRIGLGLVVDKNTSENE